MADDANSATMKIRAWKFFTGLLVLALPYDAVAEDTLPWEDARRFVEALETIRAQYAEPVDDTTLVTEAIRGMAAGLDPYSVYLGPEEYEQARISAFGRYEGIGIDVRREQDVYVVIAPFDGSPAERAGLLPGDRLLEANGESLARLDPAQFNALLQGAEDEILLRVQRGEEAPFEVSLSRETVKIPSVRFEYIGDDIAYIRIASISDGTSPQLESAIRELSAARQPAGIILDLRNNAGGVVDGAVQLADAFLDRGIIVSTHGRATGQSLDYHAQPGELLAGLPMIVLVNKGTASAAEILAGALQDHERATVLGSVTFGKGAVQSMIPLEGGGALQITTAHYRTPSGRLIEATGILPDVETSVTDAMTSIELSSDALVRRAANLLSRARSGS